MTYLVVDLETSGTDTFGRFCNPLDLRHTVNVVATARGGKSHLIYNKEDWAAGIPRDRIFEGLNLEDHTVMVGQNFKFDMLWFWRNPHFMKFLENGGMVWDTQLVEYLLMGQNKFMLGEFTRISLDYLSKKYGGTQKDDRIKVMYEAGFQTKDIDPELVLPYAEQDVLNTEIVFKKQIEQVNKLKIWPLVKSYMEHYLAITEIEYNGLYYDQELARKRIEELNTALKDIEYKINYIVSDTDFPNNIEFNPGSMDHVSAVLFGGELKYTERMPILENEIPVMFKSGVRKGEPKYRNQEIIYGVHGYSCASSFSTATARGVFQTGVDVLDKVAQAYPRTKEFTEAIKEYRQTKKLLTTYYYGEKTNAKGEVVSTTGTLPCVMPSSGCLHSSFHVTATATGRLSSSNPNIQNLDPSMLDLFKSRWGSSGSIVEFDYSQLEVVIQAFLTQSLQMIQDIKDGVDFHCKRLAYAEDMNYDDVFKLCQTDPTWKEKRRKAKVISFQKAYGASPQKISEEAGLPVSVVEKVFEAEDVDYPEIKDFYEKMQKIVEGSTHPTAKLEALFNKTSQQKETREGEYHCYGQFQTVTGKIYTFNQNAMITRRGQVFRYYRVPELQNYPIQGTAADIISIQVGKVFRYLQNNRDKCLLINEVHDSIILDVNNAHKEEIIPIIKEILESVNESFLELFGIPFNVPIKVDVHSGNSWKECKA